MSQIGMPLIQDQPGLQLSPIFLPTPQAPTAAPPPTLAITAAIYLLPHPHTYPQARLPTYTPIRRPTHLAALPPAYLPFYLHTYLPAYVHPYLVAHRQKVNISSATNHHHRRYHHHYHLISHDPRSATIH